MSFTDRITLQDATPADQHFDKVSSANYSTVRRDSAQPLDQPRALTISHEMTKDQKHQNTAIMLDRSTLDAGDSVTIGNSRVLLKISFDNEQIDLASIQEDVDEVCELAQAAGNLAKLANREH